MTDGTNTAPGHRDCTYDVQLGRTYDASAAIDLDRPFGPVTPFIDMDCPHGASARGPFYSADHVDEIRRRARQLIDMVDRLTAHPHKANQALIQEVEREAILGESRDFLGPIQRAAITHTQVLNDKLRELVK